jgi:anti-anti-sigma factor
LSEFAEMSVLSAQPKPRIVEGDIKVERAPVARRASLEIITTNMAQATAARLVGSLTSTNFMQFQDALDKYKAAGVESLVLDLSGLTYVNSTGLSLFVAAGDLFDVRLATVPSRIQRLLKMIGLDKLFPMFASVAEAAKAPPSPRQPDPE